MNSLFAKRGARIFLHFDFDFDCHFDFDFSFPTSYLQPAVCTIKHTSMRTLRFLTLISLLPFSLSMTAQGINAIRVLPAEPTSADTLYVITDFSYYGDCSYGLVYNYTYRSGMTVHVLPTYCGYFLQDSVLCQSVDTLKLDPIAQGIYDLRIEFHQGSICPISDFDATLVTYDSVLVISGTNAQKDISPSRFMFDVYPNPASDILYVDTHEFAEGSSLQLMNLFGHIVVERKITKERTQFNLDVPAGVYCLVVLADGVVAGREMVAVH
jgi:hypothetical protein